MVRALVTGATGFIGHHLVRQLTQAGHDVTCLVRATSQVDRLQAYGPRLAEGDVTDLPSVQRAVEGQGVVYHLAGVTKSLRRRDLQQVNTTGVHNVAASCARRSTPPTLVVVSSLAAAGPSPPDRLRTEEDAPAPVSVYGRTKRAGELQAMERAADVPTTIVRPPAVLGEGDRDGLVWFHGIATWGLHFVPTFSDHRFSVIHAEDLANALILAAERGRRLSPDGGSDGVYFVAADEIPTFVELGRMIGTAVGRSRVWIIRNPAIAVRTIAACNGLLSQLRRRPHILSLDKAREATAGSWSCSADALRRDVGFRPERSLPERLRQTAQWYVEQGWLRNRRAIRSQQS